MVTIKTSAAPRQGVAGKEQSLARLLEQGRVLPVISGEALEDLALGGHQRIVAGYAEHVGYPLPDRDQLHTMVKYQSLTTGWAQHPKPSPTSTSARAPLHGSSATSISVANGRRRTCWPECCRSGWCSSTPSRARAKAR